MTSCLRCGGCHHTANFIFTNMIFTLGTKLNVNKTVLKFLLSKFKCISNVKTRRDNATVEKVMLSSDLVPTVVFKVKMTTLYFCPVAGGCGRRVRTRLTSHHDGTNCW